MRLLPFKAKDLYIHNYGVINAFNNTKSHGGPIDEGKYAEYTTMMAGFCACGQG